MSETKASVTLELQKILSLLGYKENYFFRVKDNFDLDIITPHLSEFLKDGTILTFEFGDVLTPGIKSIDYKVRSAHVESGCIDYFIEQLTLYPA